MMDSKKMKSLVTELFEIGEKKQLKNYQCALIALIFALAACYIQSAKVSKVEAQRDRYKGSLEQVSKKQCAEVQDE